MERRESTIRLSEDVVDRNGVARFALDGASLLPANDDAVIAPWLDEPPTPPPKFSVPSNRPFAMTSFTSLISVRQNSASSLRRNGRSSGSQAALNVPEDKRRSADDGESSRGIVYSGSSSQSGDLRKSKSSLNLNFFGKLKSRASKSHLRTESGDSDHPSLKPPVPPLPEHGPNYVFNSPSTSTNPPLALPPTSGRKEKPEKKKKQTQDQDVASPSTTDLPWAQEVTGDLDIGSMDGIVNFNLASAGVNGIANGVKDPNSPSSPFNSAHSHSDHSSTHHNPAASYLSPSEFSDPFLPTPVQLKRRAIMPTDNRRISPKSMVPPHSFNGINGNGSPTSSGSRPVDPGGPGSPTWQPPESWAVKKGTEDADKELLGLFDQDCDSSSEGSMVAPSDHVRRRTEDTIQNSRQLHSPSSSYLRKGSIPSSKGKRAASIRSRTSGKGSFSKGIQPPPGFQYKMRVHWPTHSYQVVSLTLDSSVHELYSKLSRKAYMGGDRMYTLYLQEPSRERILMPNERPAAIIKRKMEQAGYDFEDGLHLLGTENLNMLVRFMFKSQLLAGEEEVALDNYEFVNLANRGLRTIPVILHKHADCIISLRLSQNPMVEIPLDFIQSCTTLRELRLSHMSMKKVPASLRHSTTLHRLDLSSNSIKDLEDAYLDQIQGLVKLNVQNNRLDKLPWHLPRLRSLVTLNISNNKFRTFPLVVTQLENLRDLDISFNMISEIPEEIGRLTTLQHLVIIGNKITQLPDECSQLVNLRWFDCRRNRITSLAVVCMLPQLTNLSADHNAVHALDLCVGPHVTTLDASHNDITQLSLVPGPLGRPPYTLTSLDLSYAKLSSLDDMALGQLLSLRTLRVDHNSMRSIPDSLGDLKWLETLSCADNKLDALPSTIGNLQKLELLDAHNNSLTELPQSIWNCASLMKINVTSNFLGIWHDPPVLPQDTSVTNRSLYAPVIIGLETSTLNHGRRLPPLVYSLEKLYLGENVLTDSVIQPLVMFKELRVLNLSFNEIQDLPTGFLRNMTQLEELYLSGNKLTSVPAEDFPRLSRLNTLFLNGNRLNTLPQELGKVTNLTYLDVGSNLLRYNINNWEFDWNWNFNTNLKYLNLSGNKRLLIKADCPRPHNHHHKPSTGSAQMLSGFTSLSQLRVLGLMDVTITTTSQDAAVDIPDETFDRRIRTSLSTVANMGYGIADSVGRNDTLSMIDLVHEFHGRKDEAIFAMFGRSQPARGLPPSATPNRLSKYLHDNFVNVFVTQLAAAKVKMERDSVQPSERKRVITKALHWTFLKLNHDLFDSLRDGGVRKNSTGGRDNGSNSIYASTGCSAIALYFADNTIYAANVGDSLAVVSRQGAVREISRKHDPYDETEAARIRFAEGLISPDGLVNDAVDVSRSFGFFENFPTLNACPDVFAYDLTEMDEFVIIASRGLWDFVSYQTAVDIARTERPDPMLAAQKLRDFAISYGADGSTMIMVIWVADLFDPQARSRQPTLDTLVDYRPRKKDEARDRTLTRLDGEVSPPTGHVTIVFTDIRNSTHLWEVNPGMTTAMRLHNDLLRRQLRLCGGYEVKTEGDAFMCSFPTTLGAVWWCLTVQKQLLHEPWPLEILECEDGKPIYDPSGQLIARGLSVRMGIHSGSPMCERDPITHRMDYLGPMVNRSSRISGAALGGQIMCSLDIIREINARVLGTEEETEFSKLQSSQTIEAIRSLGPTIVPMGEYKLKGIELPEILSLIYPFGLEGRHELKEAPAEPTTSASRVKFSVPQMQELGLLCLRIEALSTGRVFKPLSHRKGSIQSTKSELEYAVTSPIFLGDPELLLPPINDALSDADLTLVLDSLSLRIDNAVNTLFQRIRGHPPPPTPLLQIAPPSPPSPSSPLPTAADKSSAAMLIAALNQDNRLDQGTLDYITSIFQQL